MSKFRRYFLGIVTGQVVLTRRPVTLDQFLSGQLEVEGYPLRGNISLTSTMGEMDIGTPVDVIIRRYSRGPQTVSLIGFNTAGGGRKIGSIRYLEED
ncbi:MAG: hypothetical protein GF368_03030 [Candidatus Aenigmarchaeota archaeon]|nr:hypothetical protein [Candidatus Aenigmarchaeota archaeon]